MNRRTLLTSTGCGVIALTAGCLDRIRGNGSSQQPNGSVDPAGGEFGGFTITADSEDAAPLEYTVSITNAELYNDEPLYITIQIENTSNSGIEIGDVRDAFFWFLTSHNFALYPVDEIENTSDSSYEKDVATGRWYFEGGLIWEDEFKSQVIEGGETVSQRLVVLHTDSDTPDELPSELSYTTTFNSIAEGQGDVETQGWETEVEFQIRS